MSLFALRREYQRSFDRIFEDLSVRSRLQTEPTFPEEVESNGYQSVISLGNQRERYQQRKIKNTITPQVKGEFEFIQDDVKVWGRFLDRNKP